MLRTSCGRLVISQRQRGQDILSGRRDRVRQGFVVLRQLFEFRREPVKFFPGIQLAQVHPHFELIPLLPQGAHQFVQCVSADGCGPGLNGLATRSVSGMFARRGWRGSRLLVSHPSTLHFALQDTGINSPIFGCGSSTSNRASPETAMRQIAVHSDSAIQRLRTAEEQLSASECW